MSYFRTNIYDSNLFKIPSDWIKHIGFYRKNPSFEHSYEEKKHEFIEKYCSNIYNDNFSFFIRLSDLSKEEIEILRGFQRFSSLSVESIRFVKERGTYKFKEASEIKSFNIEDIERSIMNAMLDGNREVAFNLYEILSIVRKVENIEYGEIEKDYGEDLVNYIVSIKKNFNKILEEDKCVFVYDKNLGEYHQETVISDELSKEDRRELAKKYRNEIYVNLEELCDKLSKKKSLKLECQGEE